MKFLTFAALALTLLVSPLARATMKTEAEIESMVTRFLAFLQADKSGEAFDLLIAQASDMGARVPGGRAELRSA